MSEPDEAMVEAVAAAIDAAEIDQIGHALDLEERLTGLARAALSVPVVRDALARDAQAGCHAITDDDGTTYCPLAEANMRAVARDAQVREIVNTERPAGLTTYVWAGERHRRIAALYPSPGDRDDSEEQRRPAEAMPRIAYTYRVRPLFGGAVCLGCEQGVDVGDEAVQWTDDAITHKFCARPPIVEIEEQR